MDWLESIRRAIDCMERNLLTSTGVQQAAQAACMSSFYFQKGFALMTGYTAAEYIRGRRLYLAGLDVIAGKKKVIDIAIEYGYDTPESFTKAFTRFHGCTPTKLREKPGSLKVFLPLKISISIQGGSDMDYAVEKLESFKIIGYERTFTFDTSCAEIPRFWNEVCAARLKPLWDGKKPVTDEERVICSCKVGEFGVCLDSRTDSTFRYLIAGRYNGETVPRGMTVFAFPAMEWIKFSCSGPMPGAMQSVSTRIFKEWLPGNPGYEMAMSANIEWYSSGDTQSADYKSAVWLPVKRKETDCGRGK